MPTAYPEGWDIGGVMRVSLRREAFINKERTRLFECVCPRLMTVDKTRERVRAPFTGIRRGADRGCPTPADIVSV